MHWRDGSNLSEDYRLLFAQIATNWRSNGLPSYKGLEEIAHDLMRRKEKMGITGLWEQPPLMITATIDDGIGQGLAIIHLFAAAAGLELIPLGLMQAPQKIISTCIDEKPALLGLTVLQFDSEEVIHFISDQIPKETKIIAGGPVFLADPDFAERAGIHIVARNVAVFMEYLLSTNPNKANLP